jgi:hypothetical protein
MVKASITARNQADSSIRFWGLGVDKIPRGNWAKDEGIIKSSRHQGDPWIFDVPIPDGDHILYFVVSQTDNSIPGYSGEALFDEAGYNFTGVDNDTIAEFPVIVKNGLAKRKGASSQSKLDDIPENTQSGFKSKLSRITSGVKKIKDWDRAMWVKTGVASGIVIGGGLATYVTYKRMKKGRF